MSAPGPAAGAPSAGRSARPSDAAPAGSTDTPATQAPSSGPLPVIDAVTDYEKLNRVGEGTYGVVYKSRHTPSGQVVALKRVRFDRGPSEGVPVTAVREIKILQKCLGHPNIVQLQKVVTGTRPDSLFMVFEYCQHDLARLLDASPSPWPEDEVKGLVKQLTNALTFLHDHWVVHRDIKLSNLLLTDGGVLKLCDFGLARHYHPHDMAMTPRVVTLWYRAPELLLGATTYTEAIDAWALGCVLAELLLGEPLFPAEGEVECLQMHCALLGAPNTRLWPGMADLPAASTIRWPGSSHSRLRTRFPALSPAGLDLLGGLLTWDPEIRLTARQALQHPYFQERPYPRPPHAMRAVFEAAQRTQRQQHHSDHHPRSRHPAGAAAGAEGAGRAYLGPPAAGGGGGGGGRERWGAAFGSTLPELADLEQRLAKRRRSEHS